MPSRQLECQKKNVAAGKCATCGKRRTDYGWRCNNCHEKHKKSALMRRRQLVAAGKCATCGYDRNQHRTTCDACLARMASYRETRRGHAVLKGGKKHAIAAVLRETPNASVASVVADVLRRFNLKVTANYVYILRNRTK